MTQVEDLTPLSSLVNLRHIDLRHTLVSDIKPLVDLANKEESNLGGVSLLRTPVALNPALSRNIDELKNSRRGNLLSVSP